MSKTPSYRESVQLLGAQSKEMRERILAMLPKEEKVKEELKLYRITIAPRPTAAGIGNQWFIGMR
jgi:hypothetical protein